jgi:hypothetical protein
MNLTVDLSDEHEASIESNGSSEYKENESHDKSVSKIQESRHYLLNLEFGEEVEDAVEEHVQC